MATPVMFETDHGTRYRAQELQVAPTLMTDPKAAQYIGQLVQDYWRMYGCAVVVMPTTQKAAEG